MDGLTTSAASGMRARMESLEMLANNIANATTAGFKADREFYGLYTSAEASGAVASGLSPRAESLPDIERQWTDYSQGTLTPTGSPLDIALEGRGFLAVDGPNGQLLTRKGSLRVSPEGVLQTQEGYGVRSEEGKPIRLDPAQEVVISPDGGVFQQGEMVARLRLVDSDKTQQLVKRGAAYFQISDAASLKTATPAVHQGRLEGANFAPAEAAVRLIHVMRQFEMLQRAVTLGSEMNRKSVEDVARTGG